MKKKFWLTFALGVLVGAAGMFFSRSYVRGSWPFEYRAVNVSVRPEIIALNDPAVACADRVNRLGAVVTDRAFLGHAYRYTLKVGDLTLQCTGAADSRFGTGSAVALDFAFDQTCGLVQDSRAPLAQEAAA